MFPLVIDVSTRFNCVRKEASNRNVQSLPECRLYLQHLETLLIPISNRHRMRITDVIALSCENTVIVRQDFEPSWTPQHQTTSIGRLYVRIHAYLAKVHRTSSARTGFSRPIIKMHARYVTTLCTYISKYYPAPLSPSLFLSFFLLSRYLKCIRGIPNLSRLRRKKN